MFYAKRPLYTCLWMICYYRIDKNLRSSVLVETCWYRKKLINLFNTVHVSTLCDLLTSMYEGVCVCEITLPLPIRIRCVRERPAALTSCIKVSFIACTVSNSRWWNICLGVSFSSVAVPRRSDWVMPGSVGHDGLIPRCHQVFLYLLSPGHSLDVISNIFSAVITLTLPRLSGIFSRSPYSVGFAVKNWCWKYFGGIWAASRR